MPPIANDPDGDDAVEIIDANATAADATGADAREDDGNDLDDAPPAPAPAPAPAAAASDDDDPKGAEPPGLIPRKRFNEVNEQRKELERQNAELLASVRALSEGKATAAAPGAPAPPAEPEFDIKAARKERLAALSSGDDERALELDEAIDDYNRKQAKREAAEELRAEQERDRAEADAREFTRVATEAKTKHPQLDPKHKDADEDAIAYVIGKRDTLIAKGMSAHKALSQAVENAATMFSWKKPPTAPAPPQGGRPKEAEDRDIAARTRNADALGRQPPVLSGRGDRATQAERKSVAEMSEAEFKALTPAQLEELGGNK